MSHRLSKRVCLSEKCALLESMAADTWFVVADFLGYERSIFGVLPTISQSLWKLAKVLASRITEISWTNLVTLSNMLESCFNLKNLTVKQISNAPEFLRVSSCSVQNVTLRLLCEHLKILCLHIPNAKKLRLGTRNIPIISENVEKLEYIRWTINPMHDQIFGLKSKFIHINWMGSCKSLVSLSISGDLVTVNQKYQLSKQVYLGALLSSLLHLTKLQSLELESLDLCEFQVIRDLPALKTMQLYDVSRTGRLARHSMRVTFDPDKCFVLKF
jgi:hypothetical protein